MLCGSHILQRIDWVSPLEIPGTPTGEYVDLAVLPLGQQPVQSPASSGTAYALLV